MIKDPERDEWRLDNAKRIKDALGRRGFSSTHNQRGKTAREIARELTSLSGITVTNQDIYGWIKTGRIAKKHLPGLAA
jgi:hypothetical protein